MAVVANAWTTGDSLLKTAWRERYWPVAGVDLALLATAALGAWAARRLRASPRSGARGATGALRAKQRRRWLTS